MHIEIIVNLLNDALKTDPRAIDALLCTRVPCNQAMVDHPYIVVGAKNDRGDYPTLGVLGLLNGIAGLDGKIIEACYDDDTHCLIEFRIRKDAK